MPAQADINAAFEAWLDATEAAEPPAGEGESTLRYRRLGPTLAAMETESDYLVLCRLQTDPEYRGGGNASRLLERLKDICDRYHVTLLAQAATYDATGLDQAEVIAWYERHGFQVDHARTAHPLVWYPRRPGG